MVTVVKPMLLSVTFIRTLPLSFQLTFVISMYHTSRILVELCLKMDDDTVIVVKCFNKSESREIYR